MRVFFQILINTLIFVYETSVYSRFLATRFKLHSFSSLRVMDF